MGELVSAVSGIGPPVSDWKEGYATSFGTATRSSVAGLAPGSGLRLSSGAKQQSSKEFGLWRRREWRRAGASRRGPRPSGSARRWARPPPPTTSPPPPPAPPLSLPPH